MGDHIDALQEKLSQEARTFLERQQASPDRNAMRPILQRLLGIAVSRKDLGQDDKRKEITRKLRLAIARQAGLARAGSRRYDLNRHISLRGALRAMEPEDATRN